MKSLEQDFDADAEALCKQLGLAPLPWAMFVDTIEGMELQLGLSWSGNWIVVDNNKQILAEV